MVGGVLLVVALIAVAFVVLGRDDGDRAGLAGGVTAGGRYQPTQSGPGREPDGKPRWTEDVDCEVTCSVTADDRLVFVLSEPKVDDVRLTAYSGSDGEEVWSERFDTSDRLRSDVGALKPAFAVSIVDDVLLLSGGGEIAAHDPATGDRRWRTEGTWTGLVADGHLLVASEEAFAAVRKRDGDELFEGDGYPAAVCDGLVLSVDGDEVIATDVGSGKERWNERGTSATCSAAGTFVLDDDEVRSLDPGSGEERWSERASDAYTVAAIEGVVMAFGGDESVGLRAHDGDELWSLDGDDVAGILVGIGDGLALAHDGEGEELLILDAESGEDLASTRVRVAAIPFMSGGTIYLHEEGEAEALDLRNLDARWTFEGDEDAVDFAVGGGRFYQITDEELSAYA